MSLASMRGLRAMQQQLHELTRCPKCGKRTLVANTGGYRQSFRGEAVTAESHCTCPGGPAAHLVADPSDNGQGSAA